MYFTTTVASILALAASSVAAPATIQERQDTLQPWQLSGITSFSPSGRPGSYPWLNIVANLADPNSLTLGTGSDGNPVTVPANNPAANCTAKWIRGSSPLNHSWPCDASGDGYWVMEFVDNGEFQYTNFDVKFTRVAETIYLGSAYKKTFVGTGHFEVGKNMAGSCGGSGVCSWGLKPENSPTAIQQSEVTA